MRTVISKTRTGYVTATHPPDSFRVDGMLIKITAQTSIYKIDAADNKFPFTLDTLPVGSRVTVHGKPDPQNQESVADKVVVSDKELPQKAAGAGLVDGPLALTASGKAWTGSVNADGYRLMVTPETAITLPAGTTEPSTLPPNTWVTYKASWQVNGQLAASQIAFYSFGRSDKEQKFAKSSDFKIDPPDYDQRIPGRVHFYKRSYAILADRELADHVTRVGESLIPAWQKSLPDHDPVKVHFHFWILQSSWASFAQIRSDEAGTVLIPANLLARLKNDAQLAALLSADLAGAIQQDAYRTLPAKHTEEALLVGAAGGLGLTGVSVVEVAYKEGYWNPLIERQYRVGMAYMAAAGYDVRQAPEAIRQVEEKHAQDDEANGKQPPKLAAYLEFIFATTYGNADWSGKQVGEAEYGQLLATLHTADPKAHIQ